MSVIKVADIAWARLRSPDVDRQEEFLLDFGMVRADRTNKALYMRGTDPTHHLHITEPGEPAFIGHAYYAASEEDLNKATRVDGASGIEEIDEPGGGKRVRLKDPEGFQVEIVWGMEKVAALPVRPHDTNRGSDKWRRVRDFYRVSNTPSQVKRIGHTVLMTRDIKKYLKWYRDTLGFISSDDVFVGKPENIVGSFNRLDRGDQYVDHHVFFCWQGAKVGLNHVSYEVEDMDDLMLATSTSRTRTSTSTCGASAGTIWVPRCSTTGPTRGATCTSTGPTRTCSTSPAVPTWCRSRMG